MDRKRRKFAIAGMAVSAIVGAIGVVGIATSGSAQTPPATVTAVAKETATPTVPPTPTIPPQPTPVDLPMAVPFGPVAAEPFRVRTGDGDCLNVRPTPGTTFGSDPRTCVPEGFLLWLYDGEVQADGSPGATR